MHHYQTKKWFVTAHHWFLKCNVIVAGELVLAQFREMNNLKTYGAYVTISKVRNFCLFAMNLHAVTSKIDICPKPWNLNVCPRWRTAKTSLNHAEFFVARECREKRSFQRFCKQDSAAKRGRRAQELWKLFGCMYMSIILLNTEVSGM